MQTSQSSKYTTQQPQPTALSRVALDVAFEGDLHLADVTRDDSAQHHEVASDRHPAVLDGHLHARELIVPLAEIPGALFDVLPVFQELVDPIDVAPYDRTPPSVLQTVILQVIHNVGHIAVAALLLPAQEAVHRGDVSSIVATGVHGIQRDVCLLDEVPHDGGPPALHGENERRRALLVEPTIHVCALFDAILDPCRVAHHYGILQLLIQVRERIQVLVPMEPRPGAQHIPLLPLGCRIRAIHSAQGASPPPRENVEARSQSERQV
mmetsp:Transcript_72795/g.189514  ORF Transcript_72795/g.189514 Transcript_72795/m.189514 type:complete len:266 (-) Transcript_72795:46-843(-)